jgi:hypothetical protein
LTITKLFISALFCLSASLDTVNPNQPISKIDCTDKGCIGSYSGPEFIEGSDIAHQFSNSMSTKVSAKLKELFDNKLYSKVDTANIKMSTIGMGTGIVEYKREIPFKHVTERYEVFTSFDHCGGWNHTHAIAAAGNQLSRALLAREELDISELKTTSECLEEYWIQWKNNRKQSECAE